MRSIRLLSCKFHLPIMFHHTGFYMLDLELFEYGFMVSFTQSQYSAFIKLFGEVVGPFSALVRRSMFVRPSPLFSRPVVSFRGKAASMPPSRGEFPYRHNKRKVQTIFMPLSISNYPPVVSMWKTCETSIKNFTYNHDMKIIACYSCEFHI
jgi:hypothetical protein